MLNLRIHRTIAGLKAAWEKLQESAAPTTSVYQSYFVNAAVKRRFLIYALQGKYAARYLELCEDGQTVMIVPVCKGWKSDDYCSLGKFNGFQVYDFIYSRHTTPRDMERYLRFIMDKLKPSSFSLYNVPDSSVLYQSAQRIFSEWGDYRFSVTENENVSISAENGYDLWYSTLSKHTRQNLRTAYNRMNTDGVEMSCQLYRGQKLDRKLLNRLIDLYCQRHSSRYDVQTSPAKMLYLKYFDFSTACQQSYGDNFYAVVYMNGQIAAFMSGMAEKEGTSVVIPRLSIDEQFSRYSPGMVLINETIKGLAGDLGIRELDLSKGAEGYKLAMGGKLYYTYNLELVRRDAERVDG